MPDNIKKFTTFTPYSVIGTTKMPDYSEYDRVVNSYNQSIDETIKQFIKEQEGTWKISLGSCINYIDVNNFEVPEGLKLQLRRGCSKFEINGPNDKDWLDSQDVMKYAKSVYSAAIEKWKRIPMNYWNEQAEEQSGYVKCSSCNGEGSVLTGGMQEGVSSETCKSCLGKEGEYNKVEENTVCESAKPQIGKNFLYIKYDDAKDKLKEQGIDVNKINFKKSTPEVYMCIERLPFK